MAQLLSNLPVGAKLKYGKHSINGEVPQNLIWVVASKNHSGYPSNSITLLTERVIDIRGFDAPEPSNSDSNVASNGNNRYSLSNINTWLNSNSGEGQWYAPTHSADAPPSASNIYGSETQYYNRPGFLNSFTSAEMNAILTTPVKTLLPMPNGGTVGYDTPNCKVFLPSTTEVGLADEAGYAEGVVFALFSGVGNTSRICYPSQQVVNYTLFRDKPTITQPWTWRLRTPQAVNSYFVRYVMTDGSLREGVAAAGFVGIRPAMNLSSTLKISDTMDSDGCYTVIWNAAPYTPSILNVPTTVYGGKVNTISWGGVDDPDGDTVTYQLECSVNGGGYTQIYNGTALSYAHLVAFGTQNITYRVKAVDTMGASSGYTTSATVGVTNNYAPVISGVDANLGVKSAGFTGIYSVTDANGNAVTVTESIDGVQIRSLVATLGATITYGITDTTWLALPNGSHTFTIRATDGIDTSVRTYVFTKLVDSFTIQNTNPLQSTNMPTRIMMVVTRNIPSAATFKVEVCNNGYDATPTWEDATDSVRSGLAHVFTNTSKTASNWGIKYRITVNRNGAAGACYISAIGGNYE